MEEGRLYSIRHTERTCLWVLRRSHVPDQRGAWESRWRQRSCKSGVCHSLLHHRPHWPSGCRTHQRQIRDRGERKTASGRTFRQNGKIPNQDGKFQERSKTSGKFCGKFQWKWKLSGKFQESSRLAES